MVKSDCDRSIFSKVTKPLSDFYGKTENLSANKFPKRNFYGAQEETWTLTPLWQRLLRPSCLPLHHLGKSIWLYRLLSQDSHIYHSTTWANLLGRETKNKILIGEDHFESWIFHKYWEWWAGQDSNLRSRRQRIYSPPHLTALEPTQKKRVFESWTFRFLDGQYPIFQNSNIPKLLKWSHQSDLNWWPSVYKTDALPTELKWHVGLIV